MNDTVFISYASVVLDVAIDKVLDYGIASGQFAALQPGSHVEVPLKGRIETGYVLEIRNASRYPKVKPIHKILSEDPLLPPELLRLALWVSRHYCAPLRDLFRMILPSGVRKRMEPKEQLFVSREKTREELRDLCVSLRKRSPAQAAILEAMLPVTKGIFLSKLSESTGCSRSSVDALVKKGYLSMHSVKIDRSPLTNEEYFTTKPKTLNPEQADAMQKIASSIENGRFETHLLYGITGSGKTEIYLQAIDRVLKKGKSAIMLVPEISLTAQTIARFRSRFSEKIAVLHHRLSEGERNDEWHHIRSGNAKIVIGARSAIFSPVVDLGLIIVDEEHEQSYKQTEQSPCYQARDVAVMRGKFTAGVVILGSATPSLESFYNARQGKYTLSTLHRRAEEASLPEIEIVDMKREYEKAKRMTPFSEKLLNGIEARQKKGEQTILFLNRRGYHNILLCPACNHVFKCKHCDAPLTFHLGENRLACHLCSYQITPPPAECPECPGQTPLKFRGIGTEQIERALHAVFPDIRTVRLDADTTRHKGSQQKLLRDFGSGKADVLIGTQMIAKGLHFPEVTLVGILNTDTALNIPDFRASETVFQLVTQVSGRSGRGSVKGEVLIQTCLPDNATIRYAANHDYVGFYEEEIAVREFFRYPPFSRLAKFLFTGKDPRLTLRTAESVRMQLLAELPDSFEFHPVIPSGYTKIQDRHRFQFLMKGPVLSSLDSLMIEIKNRNSIPRQIKLFIDVNPSSTF